MPFTTSSVNPAMDYSQGWFRMTCILKEGNLTASTSGVYTQEGEVTMPTVTIASAISKEDLVAISTDTGNTSQLTAGVPVVQAISGAEAAIGICATNPKWVVAPESSQSTWATMLSSGYYRIAEVWIPTPRMFEATCPEASTGTAITPGNSLIYDNSDDGWVYARAGLSFSDNAVWDKSGADTGANGFLCEPIALHYCATDNGTVMAAHGLIPLPTTT